MARRKRPTEMSDPATHKGQLQRACLEQIELLRGQDALPTNSTFVYYNLKQAGFIYADGSELADHPRRTARQDVIDAVIHLREAKEVAWSDITDETRDVDEPYTYPSVLAGLHDQLAGIQLDPWPVMPTPMLITESRGVRSALRRVTEEYGVYVTSSNGQSRGHLMTDVLPRVQLGSTMLYFGDWNDAGRSIEANIRDTLEEEIGGSLDWTRLAIDPTQGIAPKITSDGRRTAHPKREESYECEALGVPRLRQILTEALDQLLPEPIDDVRGRADAEREVLRQYLADFDA
jgi:hypothetical protein